MKVAESKSMIKLSRVKFLHHLHIRCVDISLERKRNMRNRVDRNAKGRILYYRHFAHNQDALANMQAS